MNDLYSVDYLSTEATVTLSAGQSYYFQAYHINWGYAGYFNLAVTVPNNEKTLSFQKYGVSRIMTNAVVAPEMVNFTMKGGSSGTIQLTLVRMDPSKNLPTYSQSVNVSYGVSAQDFSNVLSKFDSFSSYKYLVTRTIYSAKNSVLTNTTNADRIDYIVSIYLLRSTALQN